DLVRAVPDDDDDPRDAGRPRAAEDVSDERLAGQRVEDLGQVGAHAGALARGEDDGDRTGGGGARVGLHAAEPSKLAGARDTGGEGRELRGEAAGAGAHAWDKVGRWAAARGPAEAGLRSPGCAPRPPVRP